MTKLIKDLGISEFRCTAIGGESLVLFYDMNRRIWAPWQVWQDYALKVPSGVTQTMLKTAIDTRAGIIERKTGEILRLPDESGMPWYSWDAILEGIIRWMVRAEQREGEVGMNGGRGQFAARRIFSEEDRVMLGKCDALIVWLRKISSEAIGGSLASTSPRSLHVDQAAIGEIMVQTVSKGVERAVSEIFQRIAPVQHAQQERLESHERRLVLVESVTMREPAEPITVSAFIIEERRTPCEVVSDGGQTIENWIGQYCRNVLKVKPVGYTFVKESPHSSVKSKRGLWHRSDLQKAIKAFDRQKSA
jgi:hypothetical protein